MSEPAVYLHLGEPKTGTSYLQGVLWKNPDELRRQGVLLPAATAYDTHRAMLDLREIARAADDPARPWVGEWDLLAARARRARRVAVVSNEMFVGATRAQASRAVRSLQPADVHIVLTVRDFASLMPAEWQETVKHRNGRPWRVWLEMIIDAGDVQTNRRRWFWTAHDTLDILQRWTELVPPDHVHVITTPRSGAPSTLLWERFASVVGMDPAPFDTDVRSNASLGVAETEMLRRLNRRLPEDMDTWFYGPQVKNRIAHRALANRPKAGVLQLPASRQQWAVDRAAEVVAGLTAAGYDIVGDLDELRPAASAKPAIEISQLDDAELLDAALAALAHVLREEYRISRRAAAAPTRAPRNLAARLAEAPKLARTVDTLTARFPAFAKVWSSVRRIHRSRATEHVPSVEATKPSATTAAAAKQSGPAARVPAKRSDP